uniref:Uncharacterized protein n=1 Tax=Coccidioides posadasii RMSCC 3488 TaxID=454284 RepID=A0A0J6F1L9_COCPO|nr:hypothetical protein CPAG_00335 [Coccidioides posadasii RMSCC 3488]
MIASPSNTDSSNEIPLSSLLFRDETFASFHQHCPVESLHPHRPMSHSADLLPVAHPLHMKLEDAILSCSFVPYHDPTIDQALHGSFIPWGTFPNALEAHGLSRLQTISHPSNDALWVPRDSANCILLRLRTTILLGGCLKEILSLPPFALNLVDKRPSYQFGLTETSLEA